MGLLDRIVQLQKKEGFAGDITRTPGVQIPPPLVEEVDAV